MADISAEVKKFREAIYGKEVREGFISLGEKVNAETEKAMKLAQETSGKVDGFSQRIEQNKSDIAALRSEHNADMESAKQDRASPIILTATGNPIIVQDSADRRVQGLKLYGKTTQVQTTGAQMFDESKIPTKTAGGATVTNNGDGSFTVSGSGNLTETFSEYYELNHEQTLQFLKAGRISVANNSANPCLCAYLYYDKNQKYYHLINDTLNHMDITEEMLAHSDCVLRIYMYGYIGRQIIPGTFKPMLYQEGDGIWEPYTGGRPSPSLDYPQEITGIKKHEIEIGIRGRNLFNIKSIESKTVGGVTVTINKDQTFTITGNGKTEFNTTFVISHKELTRMFKAGKVNLKVMDVDEDKIPIPKPYFCLYRYTGSGAVLLGNTLYHGINYYMKQEYLDDEAVYGEIGIYQQSSQTSVEGTFKVMLYQDGDETWEPYRRLQSISVPVHSGLPGIQVSSGGNYTDSKGQQWITDEIDLKRGVYIQRVSRFGKEHFNGVYLNNDKINKKYAQYTATVSGLEALKETDINSGRKAYCTHLPLGKGLTESTGKEAFWIYSKKTIVLILEKGRFPTVESVKEWMQTSGMEIFAPITPVETPLEEETIQAFKSLQTYYPNTVVTNDADTGMELEYIADTQKYIDNKLAEMNKAVVATQKALL